MEPSIGGLPARLPGLLRLLVWTDGHSSTYKGFPNFGRMGYWPLPLPAGATTRMEDGIRVMRLPDNTLCPGSEYSEGIEIVHCFFEHDHASGVQDSVGKDARVPLLRLIGFKEASIYDYHQCYLKSIEVNHQPSRDRARSGPFAATGDYVWLALSDGRDKYKATHEIIDLRHKVFGPVRGSSTCWEFQARRRADGLPCITSYRFVCRCPPCRKNRVDGTDFACLNPTVTGHTPAEARLHHTAIQPTHSLSMEATIQRKAQAKAQRKAKAAEKASSLRAAQQAAAGGPAAASTSPTATEDVELEEGGYIQGGLPAGTDDLSEFDDAQLNEALYEQAAFSESEDEGEERAE